MWSCSLFFAVARITLVASSISHFLTAAIKFSCYSSNEICLLCFFLFFFLSLALALSLLSTPMKTLKLSRKKESASLLFFLSLKVRAAVRFTAETRGYFEMQNFTPAYMKRWTYVRRFSQKQNFLDA